MESITFYSIISIFVSIFSYFFCKYMADISLVKLPFFSKKIKMDRNSQKLIKFPSNSSNKNLSEIDKKFIIQCPKYFSYSNTLFYKDISDEVKNKILNFIDINEQISSSSVNAFINNKYVLDLFYNELYNKNSSCLLDTVYNFKYPINVILKFYNNDDYVIFYVKNDPVVNIIKINNCDIYNKIIDSVFNSIIFVINDCDNNAFISNGFLINYTINDKIISNIFNENINTKYHDFLNKFDNLTIICVSSTNSSIPC